MAVGNVLVVDDSQRDLQSLLMALKEKDYVIYQTGNKSDVLSLYQNKDIDVTLVALQVSKFSGFEVLSMLKSFDPDSKIILYTEHGSKENIVRALRLGASEFLETPLTINTVLPILERLILESRKDAGLQGKLETMSLASIIQVNCEERNRALLLLRHKGQEGKIYFDQGRVVHAEINGVMGEEAVYHMLEWDRGSFNLEMGLAPPLRTVDVGWSGLVLEGVRRIDEGQASSGLDWSDTVFEEEPPVEVESGQVQRITKIISRMDEVEGVVISDGEGIVLASNYHQEDSRVAAISHFMNRQAERLAELIAAGAFQRAYLASKDTKSLVVPFGDNSLYVLISKRASADAVSQSVQMMIRRYHGR